jgi:predicted type IV restriction endonuclease
MDLIDKIRALSSQIPKQLENINTEEATKMAFVMPFINALGYNVFDPTEVCPELTADVGTKKGEKVDYAIMFDKKPMILFECKWSGSNLDDAHCSQLYRYFSVTEAKFAVLTNGIIYRFFTDTEEPNKMDSKPFFEFNMLDFQESHVEELKKLTKNLFNVANFSLSAIELKYTKEIKKLMGEQLISPSEDFIKFFISEIYHGLKTQKVYQQFSDIVKRALNQFVNEKINERLKTALEQNGENAQRQTEAKPMMEEIQGKPEESNVINVITEEEIEGFHIVKSILRDTVNPKRIVARYAKKFCAIFISRKGLVCRFYFKSDDKCIGFIDKTTGEKAEVKYKIDEVYDIYKYTELLKQTAKRLEEQKVKEETNTSTEEPVEVKV